MRKVLAILGLTLTLASCENDEQKALSAAQDCLNNATAATAGICKRMLSGHTSTEAYAMRCAADFLAEGVTATQMADALVNRDNSTTSKNSVLGMMGIISFRTTALADTAITDCNASGISSYGMLAKMAKAATVIMSQGGGAIADVGTKPTQAQMEAFLDNVRSNPTAETQETLGSLASSVHQDYCVAGGDTSKVCTTLSSAVTGNSTNQAIGAELLTQLNSN